MNLKIRPNTLINQNGENVSFYDPEQAMVRPYAANDDPDEYMTVPEGTASGSRPKRKPKKGAKPKPEPNPEPMTDEAGSDGPAPSSCEARPPSPTAEERPDESA